VTDVLIPEPAVTLKVGMADVGTVKVGQVMSGDTYADSPIELRADQAVLWEKNVSLPAPGDTYVEHAIALVADSAVIHYDRVLVVAADSPLALDGGAALLNPKLWHNVPCRELDLVMAECAVSYDPTILGTFKLGTKVVGGPGYTVMAPATEYDLDPLVCLEG
jgi:hypothetical protein